MDDTLENREFEEALTQLEEIVAALEAGELSLQEALAKFQTGMALKKLCEHKLAEAEAQIEEYVEDAATDQNPEMLFE